MPLDVSLHEETGRKGHHFVQAYVSDIHLKMTCSSYALVQAMSWVVHQVDGVNCMEHLEQEQHQQDCMEVRCVGMRMSGAKEMALVQEQVRCNFVVPVAEGMRMFCTIWNQQSEKNDVVEATSHCHPVFALHLAHTDWARVGNQIPVSSQQQQNLRM
jgi:hypothetical protein